MNSPFTLLFLLALASSTGLRLWLAQRQFRHVATHRQAVPADFVGQVPLEAHQKAADYTCAKVRLAQSDTLLDAAVLVGLTLGGGIDWLARLWAGWLGAPLWQGVAVIASALLISGLLGLPLSLLATFGVEARFGFNRTTPALYLADLAKSVLLSALLGLPLLALVLWLLTALGSQAWLAVWAVWVGFSLVLMVVFPTLIAPLFNRFVPLDNPALKSRIEALLLRCGFRASGVFVMDGSRRSSHGNAYFTGFGRAKRIVFFDTLMQQLSPSEIEAVLAHELGHFHHRHIVQRMLTSFALSLAVLAGLQWLLGTSWFQPALGVNTASLASGLLLFMLVLPVFSFPLTPLTSLLSRRHEYQADAFAARHASANDLTHALVKLYRDNAATLTPDPLHSQFYDSHPPASLRIAHLKDLPA